VNKNDLVAAVASSSGLSKADASKAVEATLGSITNALKGGGEVRLVGFGTFSVTNRAASEGRNPRTGEAVEVPGKKVPFFKAGKEMRERLNEDYEG